MGNRLYDLYQEQSTKLEELVKQYSPAGEASKKMRGAVTAELFRAEIERYLVNHKEPYKVSGVNSYIAGADFEYDLLVVKKDAEPFCNLIYRPEDVVAVVESKTNGIYDVQNDTDNIAKVANRAKELNPSITFGYITLSEVVPVRQMSKDVWGQTQESLDQKVHGAKVIYAVTLRKGKMIWDKGSDEEFTEFVEYLIDNKKEV